MVRRQNTFKDYDWKLGFWYVAVFAISGIGFLKHSGFLLYILCTVVQTILWLYYTRMIVQIARNLLAENDVSLPSIGISCIVMLACMGSTGILILIYKPSVLAAKTLLLAAFVCSLSIAMIVISILNINIKKIREKQVQLVRIHEQLETAMLEARELSGLLPICMYCKQIRDDDGFWQKVENYIEKHSDTQVIQCLCPECEKAAGSSPE